MEPDSTLPPTTFSGLLIQWFTAGAMQIDGEGSFESGDIRILPAATQSPVCRSGPEGSRFYLISVDGPPATLDGKSAASRPLRMRQRDISWDVLARGDHISPPALVKSIFDDGHMYLRLLRMDPRTVFGPHSHPGNIVYLMTEGSMEIPGEGNFAVGDARWAPKDGFYSGEIAGRHGAEFIFIQSETDRSVTWWGKDTPE